MRIGVRRVRSVMVVLTLAVCASGLLVGSAQAEGACPNEQLRAEQPYGLGLPNCRAYEMVSPLDKNGANIAPLQVRASVTGEAVTYPSTGSFSEPVTAAINSRYISRRGPDGWSTQNITPRRRHVIETNTSIPYEELVFTPDLSKGVFWDQETNTPLTPDSPIGYLNYYLSDLAENSLQLVTSVAPPEEEAPPYDGATALIPHFAGASTDLSHIVFQDGTKLTAGASPKHSHIYEWTGGQLTQVDIPPEGVTFPGEDAVGAANVFFGPRTSDEWHAVSADGSRVFFTAGASSEEESQAYGQLYVREVNEAKTIEVSASQKTSGNGPLMPARFWGASSDGSKVFFTSRAELTNDADTGPEDNAANLYEYDLETGVLNDLTVDTNVGDANGADVLGLVTAAENGSYVYFVAKGDLAGDAKSGEPNLYLYRGGKVTFIATLVDGGGGRHQEPEGGDENDWYGSEFSGNYNRSPGYVYGPGQHTVRVTPAGTLLAFVSEASLTGYDNEPAEPGDCTSSASGLAKISKRCEEVFVYNAVTGTLACVSCDPSGARPIGPANLSGDEIDYPELEENLTKIWPFYEPHNFSEDGGRLFFDSPDALVPQDSNGREDVYEYENGHVYPVSDVAGNFNSYFLDASPSGNDVFIGTADQLLPSDTDFREDVYDARVDGGYPVSVSPPPCDNGDSCKPPISLQPEVFGAPASATFSGAGNLAPVPVPKSTVKPKEKPKSKQCKKGYVRKHGRCVRQKTTRSSKHSKRGRK